MDTAKKNELMRTVKFTLFSISAGLIEEGTFQIMDKLLHWDPDISHPISLILSVIWNFTFNRKFTFKSANNVPIAMLKVLGFYVVFTFLSTEFMAYLCGPCEWNKDLAKILIMVLNFVTEFLFDRFVVFRDSIDTNVKQ